MGQRNNGSSLSYRIRNWLSDNEKSLDGLATTQSSLLSDGTGLKE